MRSKLTALSIVRYNQKKWWPCRRQLDHKINYFTCNWVHTVCSNSHRATAILVSLERGSDSIGTGSLARSRERVTVAVVQSGIKLLLCSIVSEWGRPKGRQVVWTHRVCCSWAELFVTNKRAITKEQIISLDKGRPVANCNQLWLMWLHVPVKTNNLLQLLLATAKK